MMTQNQKQAARDFAAELRTDVIAIELCRSPLPRSKTMTQGQRASVADHFGAARKSVSSSKKLYAERQPQIAAIAAVLVSTRAIWEAFTIPYRKGIRLLRKDRLESFIKAFEDLAAELDAALVDADLHYDEILESAERELNGQLFDRGDYPTAFKHSVEIKWRVHNFEPSEELLQLAPETYKREQDRVAQQFQLALERYEDEARNQMAGLLGSMLAAINAPVNGKRGIFKEATANNLRGFLERFEQMGITSDETLTGLVNDAKAALGDTTMSQLKRNPAVRSDVAIKLVDVEDQLKKLVIEAPARSISLDDLDD